MVENSKPIRVEQIRVLHEPPCFSLEPQIGQILLGNVDRWHFVENLSTRLPQSLKHVSPWISVGQRRGRDDFGRVVDRLMSEDSLYDRHQD